MQPSRLRPGSGHVIAVVGVEVARVGSVCVLWMEEHRLRGSYDCARPCNGLQSHVALVLRQVRFAARRGPHSEGVVLVDEAESWSVLHGAFAEFGDWNPLRCCRGNDKGLEVHALPFAVPVERRHSLRLGEQDPGELVGPGLGARRTPRREKDQCHRTQQDGCGEERPPPHGAAWRLRRQSPWLEIVVVDLRCRRVLHSRSMVNGMPSASLDATRIPDAIRDLARRLTTAGGQAWLVGGAVRDLAMECQPRDFDIVTDLRPEDSARAVGGGDLTDARFGVCRIDGLPWAASITTLREERGYADHRRPDEVRFVSDPALDAVRRDFTCNALYADCETGAVTDPCGGLADLQQRRLRTIGDPRVRFCEDPLRLLRMVRFEARLGMRADAATEAAARDAAEGLLGLSPERVYAEITDAITGFGRGQALRRLVDLGFALRLLPEVAAMDGVPQPPQYHPEGCVLTHVCLVLDRLEQPDPALAWSAVLHDVGKPPTFRVAEDRIRFDGHDQLSAQMAEAILLRLRAPKDLRNAVAAVCRDHIRIASLLQMRPRRREQWLRDPLFPLHLAFHRADCLGSHGDLSIHAAASRMLAELPPQRPILLTGADVVALGVAEGPVVGQLLRAAEEALDAVETTDAVGPTREQALAILRGLAAPHVKR